jgi:hypothetical protein
MDQDILGCYQGYSNFLFSGPHKNISRYVYLLRNVKGISISSDRYIH